MKMNPYHKIYYQYAQFLREHPENSSSNSLIFLKHEDLKEFKKEFNEYFDIDGPRPLKIFNILMTVKNSGRCYLIGNLSYMHWVLYESDFQYGFKMLIAENRVTPEEILHKDASDRNLLDVVKLKIPKPFYPHDPKKRFYGCLLILALQKDRNKEYEKTLAEVFCKKNEEYMNHQIGYNFYQRLYYQYMIGIIMAIRPLGLTSYVVLWILNEMNLPSCLSDLDKLRLIERVFKRKN